MARKKSEILYEDTVRAVFVKRNDRFTADVLIDGQSEFGRALVKAAKAGVEVVYYGCHVEADSIKITGVVGDTGRYRNRGNND